VSLRALDLCAGIGGIALGLEEAGFDSIAAVDQDPLACDTLRLNRPSWTVVQADICVRAQLTGWQDAPTDFITAGLPSPMLTGSASFRTPSIVWDEDVPTTVADWTPQDVQNAVLRIVAKLRPKAVMLENVSGLAEDSASQYRTNLIGRLQELGYVCDWQTLNAREYGVPQNRPRFFLVAMTPHTFRRFRWPAHEPLAVRSVGDVLVDLMAAQAWPQATKWASGANLPAPTLVAGSRNRGGADLGPSGSRAAWKRLGVDARSIADAPPSRHHPDGELPRLTLEMVARIQGFPDGWEVPGLKTAAYRLIGGACPPALAGAVARAIRSALDH
jgi:DNA (cytosine-5)-methyltransferase 1